jgi:uncharacterized SAM-binding protein YcdF (DUF218 family)
MKSFFYLGILIFGLVLGILFQREWSLVADTPANSWSEDQTADCAIVLTGGSGRIREGFDMLAHRDVQKLIISGVHPKATLKEIFPLWPYYSSLNETDVVLERRSLTTYGNGQQSLPLVEALHCRGLILITSNLHMYRALKTFRAIFPSEMDIKGRAVVAGSLHPKVWDHMVETLKSLFYALWAY